MNEITDDILENSEPKTFNAPVTAKEILKGFNFFQLSWPIAVEHFLYLFITIIDAIILSQVSITASAAVGTCAFVINFMLIAIVGFAQGSSICISHAFGGGNIFAAQSIVRASFFIITSLGMILGILQFCLHQSIPLWLGLTGEAAQIAGVFLSIVGGTTFLQAIMITIAFSLRAYGHSRPSMYVAIVVNITNIFFAVSVVKGYFGLPQMGVFGVAVATFLARCIGVLGMLYFARKHLRFLFSFRDFFSDIKTYTKKIIFYAVPVSLEPLSYQGSQIIITRVVAMIGVDALALRTYVWSVINFNSVVVFGFAQATQILVGRLYGAKLYHDAKLEFERNIKLSLISSFAMVTIVWLLSKSILSLFTHDPIMIQTGSALFAIGYLMEPGRVTNVITGSALRAVGDPKFPFYTGLIFMWGLSIPVAWFFGVYLNFGLIGVWLGLALDEITRGFINYRHFQKNKWQKTNIPMKKNI